MSCLYYYAETFLPYYDTLVVPQSSTVHLLHTTTTQSIYKCCYSKYEGMCLSGRNSQFHSGTTCLVIHGAIYDVNCTRYNVRQNCTRYYVRHNCMRYYVRRKLYAVLCTSKIVRGTMYGVNCTWYNVRRKLYVGLCTSQIVRVTMYVANCTRYNVRRKLYAVLCTAKIVRGTMYVVNCTRYSVRRKLYALRNTP